MRIVYFFFGLIIDFSYRTREEIAEVRKSRDPITGFKDRIVSAGLATEDELKVGLEV